MASYALSATTGGACKHAWTKICSLMCNTPAKSWVEYVGTLSVLSYQVLNTPTSMVILKSIFKETTDRFNFNSQTI